MPRPLLIIRGKFVSCHAAAAVRYYRVWHCGEVNDPLSITTNKKHNAGTANPSDPVSVTPSTIE